jgi:hypothetical protein
MKGYRWERLIPRASLRDELVKSDVDADLFIIGISDGF